MIGALKAKLELAALIGAAAAIVGLAGWAMLERAGRLACKVDLVEARDQVKVLAATLERQGKSIDALAGQTKAIADRTGKILDGLERESARTRQTIEELELQLAAAPAANADGSAKGCADYLKEWRAAP